MSAIIKVGFNVSYDWELLKTSLPQVYPHADIICLSIDRRRKSWNGQPYDFDEADFRNFVVAVDTRDIVRVVEGNFSDTKYTTIQNDCFQRRAMAEFMGAGGWHIQIDADEYFLDFKGFSAYLRNLISNPTGLEKPINVCANWIPLLKRTPTGYLYVQNDPLHYETTPFATNKPEYLNARRNSHFDHLSPFFVLHETWSRGEAQLRQKLASWGHSNDFISVESYLNLWKSLDEFNYRYLHNFHPLVPSVWQKCAFIKADNSNELLSRFRLETPALASAFYYSIRNSRLIQGIKQRFGLR